MVSFSAVLMFQSICPSLVCAHLLLPQLVALWTSKLCLSKLEVIQLLQHVEAPGSRLSRELFVHFSGSEKVLDISNTHDTEVSFRCSVPEGLTTKWPFMQHFKITQEERTLENPKANLSLLLKRNQQTLGFSSILGLSAPFCNNTLLSINSFH